jgi:hypothetical protein
MNSSSWLFSPNTAPPASAGELIKDYRSRLALEQFRAEERRQREMAEQSSTLNPPEVRIRAWEKVHGVRLPVDPAHPVLLVVATATDLTLEQVQEEQRKRLVPVDRAASPAAEAEASWPRPAST